MISIQIKIHGLMVFFLNVQRIEELSPNTFRIYDLLDKQDIEYADIEYWNVYGSNEYEETLQDKIIAIIRTHLKINQ